MLFILGVYNIYKFFIKLLINYHIFLFYLNIFVFTIIFLKNKIFFVNFSFITIIVQFYLFIFIFMLIFWWFFSFKLILGYNFIKFVLFFMDSKYRNFILKNKKDYRYFKQQNYISFFITNFLKNLTEKELQEIIEKYHFLGYLPYDVLLLTRFFGNVTFGLNTLNNTDTLSINTNYKLLYWFNVFLKFELSNLFFVQDITNIQTNNLNSNLFSAYSCYFFNFSIYNFSNLNITNQLNSLSKLFLSCVWIERELSEFFNIFFIGLKDSRRLLSDYTTNTPSHHTYKTTMYSGFVQDLYYKKLLHWLYIFSFISLSCFFSLIFVNRQLIVIIILGEVLLIIFFFIGLLLASLYNIFYLIGFSFFFLMIGGLELALNLLLLTI